MPAWTPASIASALWLDFSDTSKLFDATSGGSAVTNGVGIARAEDKSGNGRHFTQSTAGARPTYTTGLQNSLGGAVFDGGDLLQHATASDWTFLHSAQSTVFIVQKSGAVSNPLALYTWLGNNGAASANRGVWFAYDDRGSGILPGLDDAFNFLSSAGSGTHNYRIGNAASTAAVTEFRNVLTPNVHQLCTITSDPGNATAASRIKLGVNGGTLVGNNESTGAISGSAPTFNLQIGATNSSFYLVGNILEIVILNYAASTDIRQRMEGYLAWKWGLQSSLPSGHPYKNAEPGALPYKYPSLRDAVAGYIAGRDTGAAASDQFTADGSQNGTLTNGATRVDNGGLAYSFDGVDDVITVGTPSVCSNLPAANFTFAAWLYATSQGEGSLGTIVDKYSTAGWYILLRGISGSSYAVQAGVGYNAGDRTQISGNNLIVQNNWTHLAVTWDSSLRIFSLYINGSLQTFGSVASPSGTLRDDSTVNLCIGNRNATDRTWGGLLDDALIYPRALTSTEIGYLASARGAAYQQTGTRRRRSTMGAGIL